MWSDSRKYPVVTVDRALGSPEIDAKRPRNALERGIRGGRVDVQRASSRDVSIADLVLNRIADESIDLLVMGAYGHARVREIWLGGVTRRLMESMTVPVFISH